MSEIRVLDIFSETAYKKLLDFCITIEDNSGHHMTFRKILDYSVQIFVFGHFLGSHSLKVSDSLHDGRK